MEHLADAEVISENKFSFYFTSPGSLSWVDFGAPVEGNIKKDATVKDV